MNKANRAIRAKRKAKENRLIRAGLWRRDDTENQKLRAKGIALLEKLGIIPAKVV